MVACCSVVDFFASSRAPSTALCKKSAVSYCSFERRWRVGSGDKRGWNSREDGEDGEESEDGEDGEGDSIPGGGDDDESDIMGGMCRTFFALIVFALAGANMGGEVVAGDVRRELVAGCTFLCWCF